MSVVGHEFIADVLGTVLDDPDFSDVIFIVGEQKTRIHAHRVVLASRSPVSGTVHVCVCVCVCVCVKMTD
jgi:BTB/POZ domain